VTFIFGVKAPVVSHHSYKPRSTSAASYFPNGDDEGGTAGSGLEVEVDEVRCDGLEVCDGDCMWGCSVPVHFLRLLANRVVVNEVVAVIRIAVVVRH
jgi:hypothetical protein